MVNDRTAPLEQLDDLVDREVEIVLDAGNVARSIYVPGIPLQANDSFPTCRRPATADASADRR